jgi:hypothetical protein
LSDVEKLLALIRQASEQIETADIRLEDLSPEFQELGDAVCDCLRQGQQIVRFTAALADGDLDVPFPPRSNYMAGPIKDLGYKLKHLEWQTQQVAAGDYSQRVDFMGSFSDSFNSMIALLRQREETIRSQADEQVRAAERENQQLERQMELQYSNYQAYREYTESFLRFRAEYKSMMGEVCELFRQNRFEEGRQLVARINDQMGSDVSIRRDYSNNDCVNAALTELAYFCKTRNIAYQALIHIPDGFFLRTDLSLGLIHHMTELVYLLAGSSSIGNRSVEIQSSLKSVWMTVIVRYYVRAAGGLLPWTQDMARCADMIRCFAEQANAILTVKFSDKRRCIELVLHLPGENGVRKKAGRDWTQP